MDEQTDAARRAHRIISKIRAYWAERGFDVRAWTVAENIGEGRGLILGVRSDMRNGQPTRRLGDGKDVAADKHNGPAENRFLREGA